MAELWGISEINEWWLPDEGTCPPVVRSVRSFMGNRLPHTEAESRSEDQRNIKGIFSQLTLQESLKSGLIQTGRIGTPPSIESQSLSPEDLVPQDLGGHAADAADLEVDQDVGLENSMLSQSRESLYNQGFPRV